MSRIAQVISGSRGTHQNLFHRMCLPEWQRHLVISVGGAQVFAPRDVPESFGLCLAASSKGQEQFSRGSEIGNFPVLQTRGSQGDFPPIPPSLPGLVIHTLEDLAKQLSSNRELRFTAQTLTPFPFLVLARKQSAVGQTPKSSEGAPRWAVVAARVTGYHNIERVTLITEIREVTRSCYKISEVPSGYIGQRAGKTSSSGVTRSQSLICYRTQFKSRVRGQTQRRISSKIFNGLFKLNLISPLDLESRVPL
ncbi:hypothetical protein RRG08_047732 [Elysia crispata]|uniref:Uncharacterized protein n=1 Tax=Elysia crispata TaxID=231223 RepID=A0AAE1A933_9GAST|nr:hypothetical protein RRG08_047732 [Elysia crispata]